jgi:hypothetical protein
MGARSRDHPPAALHEYLEAVVIAELLVFSAVRTDGSRRQLRIARSLDALEGVVTDDRVCIG